jgi:NitT/TauT family transport system permease protein
MASMLKRMWGGAFAAHRLLPAVWSDALLVAGLSGLIYGLFHVAGQWHSVMRPKVEIDLSPWMLPWYTFQSLMRGLLAYLISLLFTFVYGYWAAKDKRAERILVPMLDILQSIPVLGFMPGLVIALVALFPHSNVGLELAAVIMIFTGQAWNMTFSFYRSVQTVPHEQQEVSRVFGFSWWQRFRAVELPFSTLGLVWNSMMSMAGGWFFLMLSEAFQLGDQDFRLPGLGSYMSVAADQGNVRAQIWAVGAMMAMVVTLDQLLWRPLVAWAQKFRIEEGGASEVASSWFLDWLIRSRLRQVFVGLAPWFHRTMPTPRLRPVAPLELAAQPRTSGTINFISLAPLILLIALMAWGAWHLFQLIMNVQAAMWGTIAGAGGLTMARVVIATAIGTLWTVPVGLAIGLSPRLSRIFQPVIQIAASFPASMLFPLVITILTASGVTLGYASVVLMLLGTQWYILFNVIAGAMTIPTDLREATRAYGIGRSQRFWKLYIPAIFPYLVTGWVTAMGGAWNASIVSEYVTINHSTLMTWGLGAVVSKAAADKDLPVLAASVLAMSILVVSINRLVWRRLYRLSETKFSLDK